MKRDELADDLEKEGMALIQVMAFYRAGTVKNSDVVEVVQATVDKLRHCIPWITTAHKG